MNQVHKHPALTPKRLSYFLALFGIVLFGILYYPFSQVFSGKWILTQQFDLFTIDYINFFENLIPIGTISIRFYSICIIVGMLSGYALTLFLSKRQHTAGTIIDRLFIGLVIFGLIGARLFYVAFNWSSFSDNPIAILTEITRGGLAIFGMLISCIIYVWLYCKRFKFNFYEFGDFLLPGVLLGQIFGRFGNFFNYEAYGGPTTAFWKMYVPQTANIFEDISQKYFHPTFLYEIVANFILLIFLLYKYEKWTKRNAGLVMAGYAIGYGIIRFCTEFFRLDALKIPLEVPIKFAGLTFESIYTSQMAALLLAVVGIYIYLSRRRIIYLKKTMQEVNL